MSDIPLSGYDFMGTLGSNEYKVVPVSKPRMTQKDRWAKRIPVQRYWAFKDEVRLKKIVVKECGSTVTFCLPMPQSWSKKKRDAMRGQPHQQKPDIDNLLKALLDAIFDEDERVWSISCSKKWADEGSIIVE